MKKRPNLQSAITLAKNIFHMTGNNILLEDYVEIKKYNEFAAAKYLVEFAIEWEAANVA